jgi:hypothetical protein
MRPAAEGTERKGGEGGYSAQQSEWPGTSTASTSAHLSAPRPRARAHAEGAFTIGK